MSLRIGFDMDGVLADFGSAYPEVEVRLHGPAAPTLPDAPEQAEAAEAEGDETPAAPQARRQDPGPHESRRRQDAIWSDIKATPDFWTTLKPIDPESVRRVHALMMEHRWEVFFITQRPATAGDTVQRQTQRWLVEQGFDLPSVLVLGGSRGAAAGALRLNYHVDDSPQNCLDVLTDSKAKPLLIVPDDDPITLASARKLRIGVTKSISQALDILEEASAAKAQPHLLERIAALVGWR